MSDERPSCSTCAWRATCNLKFSIGDPRRCPEFTRDVTLPAPDEDERETGEDEREDTQRHRR